MDDLDAEWPPAPASGWLSDEEESAWQAVVLLMMQLPGPLDAQLRHDAGLTLFGYLVLSALSMAPGEALAMTELSRLANGSPSRLSNVVKRFETHGWVSRRPDTDDARVTIATLTPSGRRQVEAAAPGHVETVRRHLLDTLTTAQRRTLTAVGARVGEALARGAPPRSTAEDTDTPRRRSRQPAAAPPRGRVDPPPARPT